MENYWQSKTVNIGNIRRNSSRVVAFQGLPTIPRVVSIHTPCHCTNATYNDVSRILTVKYKAGEIPPQVKGNQYVTKSIVVVYEDNTRDTLQISAIKTR